MSEQKPNFVWADTGKIRIMVHGKAAPTDEEWERFLTSTVREVNGKWTAPDRRGAVIYSLGGMATPRQRSQLKKLELDSNQAPKLVLMTDSRFARGVATALGWLVPALRRFSTFSLRDVRAAASALTPIASEQQEFVRTLEALLVELDPGTLLPLEMREPASARPGADPA